MPYPPHYRAKEKRIHTSVTLETLERIDRTAAEQELTRSELIRDSILRTLSETETPQKA